MAPPDPRIKQACDAMKNMGIPEKKVRPVLRQLRKVYDNEWEFIENDNYKVLFETIIGEDDAEQKEEKKKKKESNVVAMNRGKKRALTQILLKDKEEDDTDEDEVPLKKRSRRKRESGCDNNISLSLDSSFSSKNPSIEDLKQSDVVELERGCDNNNTGVSLGCTTSRNPNEEDNKHTQLSVKDEDKVVKEDERAKGCDNNAGLTLGSTSKKQNIEYHKHTQLALKDKSNDIDGDERQRGCDISTCLRLGSTSSKKPDEENLKLKHSQPEEEDDEVIELPPLKRYLRRTGEKVSAKTVDNKATPSFISSISTEELPPVMSLPTVPVVAAKESVSSSLTIVNTDLFTDHKPMFPDADNCSATVLVIQKSNVYVEEQKSESDVILKDTTAMVKADTSMGLVVAAECEISADGWRALSNKKDITLGQESIEIPWVNEINDEVPSRFHYIPHSYVSQKADVKFSVSSVHDNQCCFLCIGDCLASSMPCNCTLPYTSEGVLRKDFLEARISEASDLRKYEFQFCHECPLDRMEPCQGHIKREAIKECWIKCGCSKSCRNRVVQRGIHNKLEVFFTSDGRGWGLRTLERLPQGSFVCEYIGEILTISEMFQREVSAPVMLDAYWGSSKVSLDDSKSLCLDQTLYGNVSRFINHKCLHANMIEIPVHVETLDQHYYHLAFFTTRDIMPMEELTWDYGVDFNDEDGVMKPFDCVCDSGRFCRNPKRSKKAKRVMNRA